LADETDQNIVHDRQTDHTEAVFSYSGQPGGIPWAKSYIFWTQLITGIIRLEQLCILAVLCREERSVKQLIKFCTDANGLFKELDKWEIF